jgi:hypothetical protein
VHVVQETVDVKILDHIIAVLLLIQDKELEEDATYKHGQNHLKTLIDMIVYSKINVETLIVGNLMIYQAHINASMQIIT